MPRVKKEPEQKLGNTTTTGYFNDLWGDLDPAPDIAAIFRAFNHRLFKDRLLGTVHAEWAAGLTATAAVSFCDYAAARNVTIYLSKPILEASARKRMMEILLHEMIHCFCFTHSLCDASNPHGKNFRKIMEFVNIVTGLNVLPHHSLHNTADSEKSYLWRCNGICQHRAPFVGFARVRTRREPGPEDIWWQQHLRACGGTFWEIKKRVEAQPTPHLIGHTILPRPNPPTASSWSTVDADDEILICEAPNEVIHISESDSDDETACVFVPPTTLLPINTSAETRTKKIKEQIAFESYSLDFDEIQIVDGIWNSSPSAKNSRILDELFSSSSPAMREFRRNNSVLDFACPLDNSQNDIVVCPICEENLMRKVLGEHLNGCLGITVKVLPKRGKAFPSEALILKPKRPKVEKQPKTESVEVLDISSDDPDACVVVGDHLTERQRRQKGFMDVSKHFCPVCGDEIEVADVDIHLMVCRRPRKNSS